jgi:hypothetical protein
MSRAKELADFISDIGNPVYFLKLRFLIESMEKQVMKEGHTLDDEELLYIYDEAFHRMSSFLNSAKETML